MLVDRLKYISELLSPHQLDGFDFDILSDTDQISLRNALHLFRGIKSKFGNQIHLTMTIHYRRLFGATRDIIPELDELMNYVYMSDFIWPQDKMTIFRAPLYQMEVKGKVIRGVSDVLEEFVILRVTKYSYKVIIEIPFNAYYYILDNPLNNTIGSAATFSNTSEAPTFAHVCQTIKQDNWTLDFDNVVKSPYAYKNRDWFSYENNQSIIEKINLIKSKGFGGILLTHINEDDYKGNCGQGKHPLLQAAYEAAITPLIDENPNGKIWYYITPSALVAVILLSGCFVWRRKQRKLQTSLGLEYANESKSSYMFCIF